MTHRTDKLPHALENAFEGALILNTTAGIFGPGGKDWMRTPPARRSRAPQAGVRPLEDGMDRGLALTLQAIQRQLAAMPHDLYLVRLIHQASHRPFPGQRLWTPAQLMNAAAVRFLRVRNREGYDVYFHPYAQAHNAGYILIDLDRAHPALLESMRTQGHDPCVLLQTSPGHLQAWVQVSRSRLPPAVATTIAQQLARCYGGDCASASWRHLGRLAGFTNQKPTRRTPDGYAPWVKIVHARAGVAPQGNALLQSVPPLTTPAWLPFEGIQRDRLPPAAVSPAEAAGIYQGCVQRWRIVERFPQPDWSIVDLWVARHLLGQGTPAVCVSAILQLASPHFPRRHGDPQDYLRRTLARAAFPAPGRAVWASHGPVSAAAARVFSNSTGGR